MRRILLALLAVSLTAGPARALDREAVLDSLQYNGFQYFWNEANPANGLVRDRSEPGSPCSIAATGFGISAICVAIDHGWVSRTDGAARVLTTLQTFWNLPQGPDSYGFIGYKGLYYHFLDMNTGARTWSSELSTIDTALLFAGIVHAREFFGGLDAEEVSIRALADSIVHRADWDWARNGGSGLSMQWTPEGGFAAAQWVGYNEAMIMYVLAIGSPTHGIDGANAWTTWTSGYSWAKPFPAEQNHVTFNPLFGHQYSHCWIDFRGVQDAFMRGKGITYFENSKRATIAQKEYGRFYGRFPPPGSMGYSDSLWGWTACDGPPAAGGYKARGVPSNPIVDDGTIAPTAAISSIAFAPDSVWSFISNLWNNYRAYPLWGPYGFCDAFNPLKYPWVDSDVLGIDQGPIVLMIENYRTNMVWARFMQHPDVTRGLSLAGFTPVASGVPPPEPSPGSALALEASPNPFGVNGAVRFTLPRAGHVRIALYDLQGRQVALVLDEDRAAGRSSFAFDASRLAPGVYACRIDAAGASLARKVVRLP